MIFYLSTDLFTVTCLHKALKSESNLRLHKSEHHLVGPTEDECKVEHKLRTQEQLQLTNRKYVHFQISPHIQKSICHWDENKTLTGVSSLEWNNRA